MRAIGSFSGGNITAGTSLQDTVDPNAVFAGGIGIATGICLSTGFLADSEPSRPATIPPSLDVGLQGANNGFPIELFFQNGQPIPNHEGEVSKRLQDSDFGDSDFRSVHSTLPNTGGDPAVLQFEITQNVPGFLRVSFVFGSDEYPGWIQGQWNDTIVILVKGPTTPPGSPGQNLATFVRNGTVNNFSLHALEGCPQLFLKNKMAPESLAAFPTSQHNIPDANYYDHEFGGFSNVLTRETAMPLAPGTYTVKFVIEDIGDRQVDSALFIPTGSLKLFPLNQGDYNGDGVVNSSDYSVWRSHYGMSPASFSDGDGNGDGTVDTADYVIWRAHRNETGNPNLSADFDRNGCVDGDDFLAWQRFAGMTDCASRFEGDADGDGDVDNDDLGIWQAQVGSGNCGTAPLSAMSSNSSASLTSDPVPESPDVNDDGLVDETDLSALDHIILDGNPLNGSAAQSSATFPTAPPEPTLAEPQQ